MTREEKIEWLRNASTDQLLRQYETCTKAVSNLFDHAKNFGLTPEEVVDDYELVKAEVIRRMN